MSKSLLFLILVVIVLCWKFIFTSSKIEYTDSAKVLQSISMALPYKLAVQKYWQEKGEFPSTEAWVSMAEKPKVDISQSLVSDIKLSEMSPGVISIYFENKPGVEFQRDVSGKKVLLKPEIKNDRVKWTCKGTIPKDLLPGKCIYQSQAE